MKILITLCNLLTKFSNFANLYWKVLFYLTFNPRFGLINIIRALAKMFKFLNQCFAQLRFWKGVSDSRNLLDVATAVLLETLFQNRSRAKH